MPHSANSIRDAPRCGGRPVIHDGHLYRFGQDCQRNYGHRLLAFRIDTLNTSHFAEVTSVLSQEISNVDVSAIRICLQTL